MPASEITSSLIERALQLDKHAVSALISLFEDQRPSAIEPRAAALEKLRAHPARKHAALLGLTGTPGSGKSTLLSRLTPRMLELRPDLSIAVLAVDPSSPISGGALLGDRTRMRSEPTERRLFFRSQASETQLGGLAPSSFQVCRLLACLFDCVLIETVGIGQGEADIRHLADRVVLVLQPLGGDEIQFLKAGIMEVPDAFVVNKCDEPSAHSSYHTLCASLTLARAADPEPVPVYRTSARSGEGIDELAGALLAAAERVRGSDIRHKEAHFFTRWVQEEWGRRGVRLLLSDLGGARHFLEQNASFEYDSNTFRRRCCAAYEAHLQLEPEPDASRCPLCHGPNECGMLASVAHCWCFSVEIRPEVMADVPLEAAGRSCLCRACAGGAHQRGGVLKQIQELLRRRR